MSYLQCITESNKLTLNKPANADQVYYSQLYDWYTTNAFRSFSIKYVLEGSIYYRCNQREYRVNEGHFLLTSKQPDVRAFFESDQFVKSICIDICPQSVAEAFSVLGGKDDFDLDNYAAGYFENPFFVERLYAVNDSALGKPLTNLARAIGSGHSQDAIRNEEWFLYLVEMIVRQERSTHYELCRIDARKPATRREIYLRLLQGRDYLDAHFREHPSISTVSRHCNLSSFHFYRSFQQAFGTSPYQYMMQKRLKLAARLIRQENDSLSGIAIECGFPDLFTFSKAFKKVFGMSPRKWLRAGQLGH